MTEQEIIDWLLDSDPAIRWQVMRDLLGEEDETFTQERMRISTLGWGADLLSRQDTTGRWAGQLYDHKWISTTYTMQLLRRVGLDPEHPQAHKACQQLLDGGYKKDGALSFAKTVSHIDLGVCGLVLSILAYFGYPDQRVHSVTRFLLDQQLLDGSWLPEPGVARLQYICAGTILILDGLHEYEKRYSTSSAQLIEAQTKGREFLLGHKLFKSKETREIIDRKMTRFSFPPRWHYDVLVALDYFQDYRAEKDARLSDAIELVKFRRRKDRRWNLQNRHPGKTYFEMEEVGQPSRWNTLRALRVLKWWGED